MNLPKKITPSTAIFVFLLIAAVAAIGVGNAILKTYAKYAGDQVMATVTVAPFGCNGKGGRIKVSYQGKDYELNATNKECTTGTLQIGQALPVIKHPAFDYVLRLNDWPFLDLLLLLGFLFAAIAFPIWLGWKYNV